ncbi:DNA adenine methylase [Bradyrhizobium sp. USDA 326]|uniref:DNA adenine methylase n=1 Tax=unclassified Bradyrhizobium TaxID=2631580 RepID=UPI003517DE5A
MTEISYNRSENPKFLRWAGSKSKMLSSITSILPPFSRYIEPFCGSCALYFHLQPKSAVLSDINPLLIRTIKAVRREPHEVFQTLQRLKWSEDGYYKARDQALSERDNCQLAANFIYLNANCFNGIFRLNRAGKFNVPYGGDRAGKCPSEEKLASAARLLRRAKIVRGDFESVVKNHCQSGDLVYLDPPFALRNRRIFFQYRYDDFGTEDIARLRGLMAWIDKQGSAFVVSYAASPEAKMLSKGWRTQTAWRLGNIAGFRDRREKLAKEVLITNV